MGLGIGLFAVTTIFAFITLPVEFDASARALKWLDRSHLMNYFDHGKAKSALFWAAMTYVVGALSSLAMLLYYVFIFMNARGETDPCEPSAPDLRADRKAGGPAYDEMTLHFRMQHIK